MNRPARRSGALLALGFAALAACSKPSGRRLSLLYANNIQGQTDPCG